MKICSSVLLLFFFTACTNNDKKATPQPLHADGLFLEYKIAGEEGFDKLTVLARFQSNETDENPVAIPAPAKIELDGKPFIADSAAMSGVFYELHLPIVDFAGSHVIAYTNADGQEVKETFQFEPMVLRSELPEEIKRSEIAFDLGGVKDGDLVRILMTDTSFTNEGVSKIDTVQNGRLVCTPMQLSRLANGPIQLELIREQEKKIMVNDKRKGRFRSNYIIRRSFTLID